MLRLFILITYVLIIIMAVSSANLPGIRVPLVSLIPVTTLCGMFYDGPSMLGPKEYTAYLLEQEAGLCLEDFTYLQNVLTECYSFKAWDALKYLESIYLANFQKYDKGTLHFVYTMRNGTAYWEGIMLDGKHVLKAS